MGTLTESALTFASALVLEALFGVKILSVAHASCQDPQIERVTTAGSCASQSGTQFWS